ncbi:MAG: hypothetical protein QXP80_01295 [Zestosphaera sp.]
MRCFRFCSGVSAYVANVILLIVVLGALALIYAHFNAVMSLSESVLSGEFTELRVSMNSNLVITATYIDGSYRLHVIVSSGAYPVRIYSIYADETLTENCTQELELRPYDIVEIVCQLPENLTVVNVKVTHSGGLIEGIASKI